MKGSKGVGARHGEEEGGFQHGGGFRWLWLVAVAVVVGCCFCGDVGRTWAGGVENLRECLNGFARLLPSPSASALASRLAMLA